MKILTFLGIALLSFNAFAFNGPTGVAGIAIGMNKSDYLSFLRITPDDCNKGKDLGQGIVFSGIESLSPENKSLCHDFRLGKKRTGIIENVEVNGIVYDVVQANYQSSESVRAIGNSIKAIFIKDRLISLEIYSPEVSLEILESKYGPAALKNNVRIKTCQNKIGGIFENRIGDIDAVWTAGEVNAIYRRKKTAPRETCTDGIEILYYILEETRQVKLIESAIMSLKKQANTSLAKDSKF